MDVKKYYVIIAKLGGDGDICYYIFTDETYFKAFLEFQRYADRGDNKSIVRLIENYKEVDGLFSWVTKSQLCDKYLFCEDESVFKDTYISVSNLSGVIDTVKDGVIVSEAEIIIA